MQRQERDNNFKLSAIIGEGALRIPVGASDVMRRQLHRLAEIAEDGRHEVQVHITAAGEHASMASGSIRLRFVNPIDPPLVYLETHAGGLYVEEEEEVQHYTSLFQDLSDMALSVGESARFMSQIADTI